MSFIDPFESHPVFFWLCTSENQATSESANKPRLKQVNVSTNVKGDTKSNLHNYVNVLKISIIGFILKLL